MAASTTPALPSDAPTYERHRPERCGDCGGTLRVIACIETPELIERILAHLATRAPPLGAATA